MDSPIMLLKWIYKPALRPINKDSSDQTPILTTCHSLINVPITRIQSY